MNRPPPHFPRQNYTHKHQWRETKIILELNYFSNLVPLEETVTAVFLNPKFHLIAKLKRLSDILTSTIYWYAMYWITWLVNFAEETRIQFSITIRDIEWFNVVHYLIFVNIDFPYHVGWNDLRTWFLDSIAMEDHQWIKHNKITTDVYLDFAYFNSQKESTRKISEK